MRVVLNYLTRVNALSHVTHTTTCVLNRNIGLPCNEACDIKLLKRIITIIVNHQSVSSANKYIIYISVYRKRIKLKNFIMTFLLLILA